MAIAFKCDKCGNYQDDKPTQEISRAYTKQETALNGSSTVNKRETESFELCDSCIMELTIFLKPVDPIQELEA